jgi:membrane associated rhomboid family serine protease
MSSRSKSFANIGYPILFVFILWVIKLFEIFDGITLVGFGILPRTYTGFIGIFTAPLIHGDMYHLFSNSIPLIVLGIAVFYFYKEIAFKVFFTVYFISDVAVWIFASAQGYHIGASGLIYGFVSFLFFSGIFRSDRKSMALSLLVVFLYGGLVWGMFPVQEGISWEAHFFGAGAGAFSAFIYRKVKSEEVDTQTESFESPMKFPEKEENEE